MRSGARINQGTFSQKERCKDHQKNIQNKFPRKKNKLLI